MDTVLPLPSAEYIAHLKELKLFLQPRNSGLLPPSITIYPLWSIPHVFTFQTEFSRTHKCQLCKNQFYQIPPPTYPILARKLGQKKQENAGK